MPLSCVHSSRDFLFPLFLSHTSHSPQHFGSPSCTFYPSHTLFLQILSLLRLAIRSLRAALFLPVVNGLRRPRGNSISRLGNPWKIKASLPNPYSSHRSYSTRNVYEKIFWTLQKRQWHLTIYRPVYPLCKNNPCFVSNAKRCQYVRWKKKIKNKEVCGWLL